MSFALSADNGRFEWRGGGGGRGAAPAGGGSGAADNRPRGTDLIIRELASGSELNTGNVSEFAFTTDGTTGSLAKGFSLQMPTSGTDPVTVTGGQSFNYDSGAGGWTIFGSR